MTDVSSLLTMHINNEEITTSRLLTLLEEQFHRDSRIKLFKCKSCNLKYSGRNRQNILEHVPAHIDGILFKCSKCYNSTTSFPRNSTRSFQSLSQHISLFHDIKVTLIKIVSS